MCACAELDLFGAVVLATSDRFVCARRKMEKEKLGVTAGALAIKSLFHITNE